VVAGVAIAAVTVPGRVGPRLKLLQSGRKLTPQGKLVTLGNFPTGAALTRDGRFYWTVSTGRGRNDIRIVSLRTAKVVQVIPLPGASGGIAMDPASNTAYVSGVPDSEHKDEALPGAQGREGDVIHVFRYAATGRATFTGLIPVPPPSDAPAPQEFPPTNVGQKLAWPDRLAVSRDGKRLLVPLNLADAAAIVDVSSKQVRYVKTGNYPYGAAILRDGKTGLVSNETPGTVSVVDLDAGTKVKDIQVGSHLSHPEAIAVDPRADRAYVAIANSDQVAVIDTQRLVVARTLSVARPEGDGTSPVDVSVTPGGTYLLVADAGAD
jgi:DNA-binding beta-propeller fold protein YncE